MGGSCWWRGETCLRGCLEQCQHIALQQRWSIFAYGKWKLVRKGEDYLHDAYAAPHLVFEYVNLFGEMNLLCHAVSCPSSAKGELLKLNRRSLIPNRTYKTWVCRRYWHCQNKRNKVLWASQPHVQRNRQRPSIFLLPILVSLQIPRGYSNLVRSSLVPRSNSCACKSRQYK